MARQLNKLTSRSVTAISTPGRHGDGGGLYLVVDKNGAKRWVFLYRREGRLREMGLGGVKAVSLAAARDVAEKARLALKDGGDPIAIKQADPPPAATAVPTFGEMADDFVATMGPQFRNAKHLAQWKMTLSEYAKPLREKAVDAITTDDVVGVLKPIWATKPETASRLRGRIERVLDAAKAKGLRSGENPALWRSHLSHLLPKSSKLSRGHHAALEWEKISKFMAQLRERQATAARALEFTILTAARTGETLGARWSEIDRVKAVWTVPAERMKANREHRVPLTGRAVEILDEMALVGEDPDVFIFPGMRQRKARPGRTAETIEQNADRTAVPDGRGARPLSNMSMEMLLRRIKTDVTVHGFRSSFRDWAGEETSFPRELAEAALAHVIGDETERAYRRGDALAKRRELMVAWDKYCAPSQGTAEAKPAIFD